MFYILTCSFPASEAAAHDTVFHAAWVWLQSSAHYSFPTVPAGIPSGFPFRQIHTGGEDSLELLGCVMDQTEYSALRLTRRDPQTQNNVKWVMDLIFEKPRAGTPWIRVQLGRSPLDPQKPCMLGDPPRLPGLIAVLDKEGQILPEALSRPRILVAEQYADRLHDILRRRVGLLGRVGETAAALPGGAAIRVEWDTCGFAKDYAWSEDPETTTDAAVRDIFWLMGQVHGDFQVSLELLRQRCPQLDDGTSDTNISYCFMNEKMAGMLRKTRRERGLSQHALAQLVQVSNLVISRLETLRVSRAPVALIRDIEQALRLPADAILSLQNGRTEPVLVQIAPPEEPVHEEPTPPREEPVPVREESAPVRKNFFCRLCGTKLYEDSRFCSNCGGAVLL